MPSHTKELYANIPGIGDILQVNVSTSHSASTASAQITCLNPAVSIGDDLTIDLGYVDNHAQVFKGYVKTVNRQVPNNVYTITAKDILVRAIDYFVVPTDPEDSYKRSNIKAEDLVGDVLQMAGIDDYDPDDTDFTFATRDGNEVEVKLTSAYDFVKMIADLLAWQVWADETGTVHFKNRKPYKMTGATSQPGDPPGGSADVSVGTINDAIILEYVYVISERDLRNRVVVHGAEGVFAESQSSTSLNPVTNNQEQILPAGFYKSMALVSPIIDSDSMASRATEYNLDLYNKLTVSSQVQVEGNPLYLARKVITAVENIIGINNDWYIYLAEHQWSRNGYLCNLELRI